MHLCLISQFLFVIVMNYVTVPTSLDPPRVHQICGMPCVGMVQQPFPLCRPSVKHVADPPMANRPPQHLTNGRTSEAISNQAITTFGSTTC